MNFIIISFTIQNIDSNIIHPGRINDWNLKITYTWNPEKFTFHPLSTSIFEFHPFIFQGVPRWSRYAYFQCQRSHFHLPFESNDLAVETDFRMARHGIIAVTPWKINDWNLQLTHLERKMIFQTSMEYVPAVNRQGCSFREGLDQPLGPNFQQSDPSSG